MRLGIYGGSFDPVHFGHLLLAETCREQALLDEVWFLPAETQPFKRGAPPAPAKHRVEMLQLAIAGHAAFRVSTLEVDRGGVSYTIDTLRAIAADRPGDELFLLMGADTLKDLPKWREPQAILELALPLAVARHGSPPAEYQQLAGVMTPERLDSLRQYHIEMPVVEFSSSELRDRIAANKTIRYRTPRAVEKYIETHSLYR